MDQQGLSGMWSHDHNGSPRKTGMGCPKLHSIYYEPFVIIFYCLTRKETKENSLFLPIDFFFIVKHRSWNYMRTQREIVIDLFLFRRNPRRRNLWFYYTVIIIFLLYLKNHNVIIKAQNWGYFTSFVYLDCGLHRLNLLSRPDAEMHSELYGYWASFWYYYYERGNVKNWRCVHNGTRKRKVYERLKVGYMPARAAKDSLPSSLP